MAEMPPTPPPPAVPSTPGGAHAPSPLEPQHLYHATVLAFFLALLFRFFDPISQVMLLGYAACILAVALNPLTKWAPLKRRWVAAGVAVLVVSGLLLGLGFGVPALGAQARELGTHAPEIAAHFHAWGEWVRSHTGLNIELLTAGQSRWFTTVLHGLSTGQVLASARDVVETFVIALTVFFAGLFILANPNDRLLTPMLRVFRSDTRDSVRRMLELLASRLQGWVRGTLLAMVAMGVLGTVALHLIGVPYSLLLGIFMGLGEFVPIIGPWITSAPPVIIAFIDSPTKGLWTLGAVIALQQFEANMLVPWAMSRQVEVHPVVSIFAIILFGRLFGFLGLLLAIPIVLLLWTLVQVLWVERTIETGRDVIAPVVKE